MALKAGYYGLKKKIIDKVKNWDQIVFTRAEQRIVGATNLISLEEYGLGVPSSGDPITLQANSDSQAFVAKIERNTNYWISKSAGNRFRIAVSTTEPAAGSTAKLLLYKDNANHYAFNSGNYDYVIMATNTVSQTNPRLEPSVIKPMLALYETTDYVPYAMTNKELTDAIGSISGGSDVKTLTYTGDGQTTSSIDFSNETADPTFILGIFGESNDGYYMAVQPFPIGVGGGSAVYSPISSGTGGMTHQKYSFSSHVLHVESSSADNALNYSGKTYTVYYI